MIRKITIFLLLAALMSTQGCYALRKKFIRKKKYVEETPVYVDFKSYPTKPSREAYNDYFLFVKGWLGELGETLKHGESFKRAKRGVNEALMNFEQIISFFNAEGKENAYPLYEDLRIIKQDIETNPNPSDMKRNSIVAKIEKFRRQFEADFKYSDAEQWMN
ncbi:MAG: hypothetical protein ABH865_01670 [Candidatus Omnitrophota bacterium]